MFRNLPRSVLRLMPLLVAVLLLSEPALGHHSPMSSAVAAGPSGISKRRATTNTQASAAVTASEAEIGDARGTVLAVTPALELAPAAAWSASLAVPALWIDGPQTRGAGLGNLSLSGKWLFFEASSQRALVLGQLGLPTQTVHLGLDPGPVIGFGSAALHSWETAQFLLQTQLGVSGDTRRAGTALDLLASVRGLYWLSDQVGFGGALLANTRAVSWCVLGDQVSVCDLGRASESRTKTWSPALSIEAAVEASLWEGGGLRAAARLPLTERRDAEWSTELVLVVGF